MLLNQSVSVTLSQVLNKNPNFEPVSTQTNVIQQILNSQLQSKSNSILPCIQMSNQRRRNNGIPTSRERSRGDKRGLQDYEAGEMVQGKDPQDPFVYGYLKFQAQKRLSKSHTKKKVIQKPELKSFLKSTRRAKKPIQENQQSENQNDLMSFPSSEIKQVPVEQLSNTQKQTTIASKTPKQQQKVSIFNRQNDMNVDFLNKFTSRYDYSLFLSKDDINRDFRCIRSKNLESKNNRISSRSKNKKEDKPSS